MIKDQFSKLLEATDKDELFKMFSTMFSDDVMKDCGLRVAKEMKDRLAIKDEEELANFVNSLPPSVLSEGVKKNFTREMLIEELKNLSENTQEGLIKYYQGKNRTIDILKGVLDINSNNELIVRCSLAIYSIHKDSLLERDFHSDEQVFGVLRNDNFCILEEIRLKNGKELFGYVVSNNLGDNTISFRLINGFCLRQFDKAQFNPYSSEYDFGALLTFSKEEIEKRK